MDELRRLHSQIKQLVRCALQQAGRLPRPASDPPAQSSPLPTAQTSKSSGEFRSEGKSSGPLNSNPAAHLHRHGDRLALAVYEHLILIPDLAKQVAHR